MKKNKLIIIIACIIVVSILILFFAFSKSKDKPKIENTKIENEIVINEIANENNSKESENDDMISEINLTVNNNKLSVKLEDNSSSRAFVEKLKEKDIVVQAHDYGNFEKVGDLGFSLPTNDTNITTKPGDIILYQGNQLTVYYDTNTWNFTKLGEIEEISKEELRNILGEGNVTLKFSL